MDLAMYGCTEWSAVRAVAGSYMVIVSRQNVPSTLGREWPRYRWAVSNSPPQPADEPSADARESYTAVVYFHGIGNQRRFEETSRLVDALDKHAFSNEPTTGRLVRAVGRTEPSRLDGGDDESYIRLEHHHRAGDDFVDTEYRFYEAYWAPITAGATSSRAIVGWALRQAMNPIRPLLRRWRSQPRLHRTYLYRLHAQWPLAEHPYRSALKPLTVAYDDFENPDQLRAYPKGTFKDFIHFLESEERTNRPDVLELAHEWRRLFTRSILWNQVIVATLVLAIALGLAALIGLALLALEALADVDFIAGAAGRLVEPSLSNAATLALAVLGAFGITTFTRRYLGDVVAWATYEETDEKHRVRSRVLDRGVSLLQHVLADPRCDRVVVVGHSLGTTVAHDVLLAIGQHALARGASSAASESLDKLDQLITLASPVDTIHAMFESHVAKYHRYTRVFESLRGDLGRRPFSHRRRPHIHWINVWDRADIISGPLFSPNQKRASAMPVDNVEVASLRFPDPASSHVAYFANRDVIRLIFDVVFQGRYSYRRRGDLSAQRIGTSVPNRRTTGWQLAMLVTPWVAAAYGVARLAQAGESITWPLGWGSLALLTVVAGGFATGRSRGHRAPLTPDADQAAIDPG